MGHTLLTNQRNLTGTIQVPGDKSISHRSLMFGAISEGKTVVDNLLFSEDCLHTLAALRQLGVPIQVDEAHQHVEVTGVGLDGLQATNQPLNMGNSGTSTRLLMGLLVNQPFPLTFVGDGSLSQRPLKRVTDPLQLMGAKFEENEGHLPITMAPSKGLSAITYKLPVASAQVKSAILLAAIQADQPSVLVEKTVTRDHTERMLQRFGGEIKREGLTLTVTPKPHLTGQHITVPGDFSSAAFFLVAGLLVPDSTLVLKNVGLNQTRTGLLKLLKRMGAVIEISERADDSEPTATLTVHQQALHRITVDANDVALAIDEIPLVALLATQATGQTVITGAEELRFKETDRIKTVSEELNKLGAHIAPTKDGMVIEGQTPLKVIGKQNVDSHGDHRIAMMLAVAALITEGQVDLQDAEAVAVSYPTFLTELERLCGGVIA